MKLILVDSYDSFTHNLVQAFRTLGADVVVVHSDQVDSPTLGGSDADLVVLGPGPGHPEDAGCLVSAAATLGERVPLLGVCLGHQAIALAFGGAVVRRPVVHGHATPILHDSRGLFQDVLPRAPMTRYHSLGVDPHSLPPCLAVSARSPDGTIQGLRHRTLPVFGVQFHPESVLSGAPGLQVLRNFVNLAVKTPRNHAPDPRRAGTDARVSALP